MSRQGSSHCVLLEHARHVTKDNRARCAGHVCVIQSIRRLVPVGKGTCLADPSLGEPKELVAAAPAQWSARPQHGGAPESGLHFRRAFEWGYHRVQCPSRGGGTPADSAGPLVTRACDGDPVQESQWQGTNPIYIYDMPGRATVSENCNT